MSLFFYKKENNWVCVFCILMAIVFCGLMIISVVALFIPNVKFMKDNFSIFINEIENDMPRIIQSAYKEFKPECFFTDKTKAFKREILNISSYKNEHKNLEKFLQSMNLF